MAGQQPRAFGMPEAIAAMLAFGGLGILMISALAPASSERWQATALATVSLADDDGGRALFEAVRLAPGHPVSNCLDITHDGDPGTVHVLADDVVGPLAATLNIRVEVGTGGRFGDCTGFSGAVVYDGTLAGLDTASAGESGVATGWSPQSGEHRVFRLTATVPDGAAHGASTNATLAWVLVPASTPPLPPPPTSSPTSSPPTAPPTSVPPPATSPASPPVASPTSPAPPAPSFTSPPPLVPSPTPPAVALPRPTTTAQPPSEPSATPPQVPGEPTTWPEDATGGTGGGTRDSTRHAATAKSGGRDSAFLAVGKAIGELALRTVRHGVIPLASLGAMAVFLFSQELFDRRDPKLALARIGREPLLPFDDHETELRHTPDERSTAERGHADAGHAENG
jgi:hypothetical protein